MQKEGLKMKCMKTVVILLAVFTMMAVPLSADEKIKLGDDLELLKLSETVYRHISYKELSQYGRVPANGIVYISGDEAAVVDTPWSHEQTSRLLDWIADEMGATVTVVIPSHWHEDCMGGLSAVHERGIPTVSYEKTRALAHAKGLPVSRFGFRDTMTLSVAGKEIECAYCGAGHTVDNIVVWIPSEKLLFGGCLVKAVGAKGLGNTADADVPAWPATLNAVLDRFPVAETVVPGHGAHGGLELIRHTLTLFK